MSLASSVDSIDLYGENSSDERILDLSSQCLTTIPIIENKLLCALYLQDNNISTLPDDFFPSLLFLQWLDLRNNVLTEIPASVQFHPTLTHLLLQENKLKCLPNELGTVKSLKVLQIRGNPLAYPPGDVLSKGTAGIVDFLRDNLIEAEAHKFIDDVTTQLPTDVCVEEDERKYVAETLAHKMLSAQRRSRKDKCSKLAKSRSKGTYSQSSKYVKTSRAPNKLSQSNKIMNSYLEQVALAKHKYFLETNEKIIQERKNLELLRNWRADYRNRQLFQKVLTKLDLDFPYDTNPDYMALLTREDIVKDLPDKYAKRLKPKCRPTVPRKLNSDVHLAMKIKQLFQKLEDIDLNKGEMTPKTEQMALRDEIQKINEIKKKLSDLTLSNAKSVIVD